MHSVTRLVGGAATKVTLEAPPAGVRAADLLAVQQAEDETRKTEGVAIEIETGRSDAVGNMMQDLLT